MNDRFSRDVSGAPRTTDRRRGARPLPLSGAILLATLVLVALLVAVAPTALADPARDRGEAAAKAPAGASASADDLVIVDCLLPPKVRRLGRRNTYLAPRQPVKTTALDCRIRGGEHTQPDQANLGTALRVWLPQAKAGDAEAQYYVGQLFERGLGVDPDPAAAAEWYRKAAEQGDPAAQVSLGSLYEAGRGVPADAEEAMRWYRRAAGLAEDLVVLQGGEYEELRASSERLSERLEEARRELAEKDRRLREAGEASQGLRQEVEALRREVERLEAQRESQSATPGGGAAAGGTAGATDGATREAARFDLGRIPFGRYHALVIGNSTYRHLPSVPTAAADARAVASTLEQRYGFRVRLLQDATRYDVMRALNDLRKELTSDDNLLVYYAGHARREEGSATAYWQPVDAEPGNAANWIPSDLVSEHLDLVPARHVLVVADALFSGLRSRSAVARLPQGMTAEERFHHVKLLRDKRCRLVLASGQPAPRPAAPEAEHSGFSSAFVRVLRENDGVLEASRVYERLQRALTDPAARGSAGNGSSAPAPEFAAMQWARTDVSDFFFVPRS